MSFELTGEDLRLCLTWLGPWLVGGRLDLLLQGVLCTRHSMFDDHLKYTCLSIFYFGDLQFAIQLNYTAWWKSVAPLVTAIIGFYVQSYLYFRLWVISKKGYIVTPIATIFLFAFLAIVIGVAAHLSSVFGKQRFRPPFLLTITPSLAGDVTVLCLSTAYFLLKSKKEVAQTAGFVNALVRVTFQIAAPAAVWYVYHMNPCGSGITSAAFNTALPKPYAVSKMWTLNARCTIRAHHHSSKNGMATASNELSGARSRAPRRGADVELGPIEVFTQTETTHHIDVSDMFNPNSKNGQGNGKGAGNTGKSDNESVKDSK
ncbi:hypothetical protein B0H19DRAFT_1257652 [Mycena capillaripes]|nr:hypothetical protein B0H19DRAFT_1257652 [Mycena capillaripes]